MRKKVVAGNWKMNKDLVETKALLSELKNSLSPLPKADIIVAPTFVNLASANDILTGSGIQVAAQNMHQMESGAYTGEVSVDMLKSVGVGTVILGHSERRAYFGESDALLNEKVKTALKHGMQIIFCFGEELDQRKEGVHFEVVENQLKNALFDLEASKWEQIILAYEPVWAIGTGETATPEQAQEMHKFIRKTIQKVYGKQLAEEVSILYGGSVKPNNAKEIFAKPDVDGGLIGGASLNAENFTVIANAI